MTPLEKKSLTKVSNDLKKYDSYELYRSIYDMLDELEIGGEQKKEILAMIQKKSTELTQIVKDSKEWIDVIIENN